jgi:Kdo2-lipid IVA lauroyltransferase/acyltransferase
MSNGTTRLSLRAARKLKDIVAAVAGVMAVWTLRALRRMDPDRIAGAAAAAAPRIGRWLPEHRVGRTNLAAAYPEKSPREVEDILRGVWDNLGRVVVEYAHLDRLWDYDPAHPNAGRIELSPGTSERLARLRDDGKPALIFAAHLGNWELPALAAAAYGLDTAILYRAPNVVPVAEAVRRIRTLNMGMLIETGIGAPAKAATALKRGAHFAMLVDQFYYQGTEVTFFGRRCKANPMIARLARHFDCPIHGTRVVRLPGGRFRIELTEALVAPRDLEGRIDPQATTQLMTSMVEGWIREHPEQWLWLHRRWR